MLINRENSYNVHYVLGYECDDGYVPSSSVKGDECNNLPKDVKRRCKSKVFATWSFGSRHVRILKKFQIFIIFKLEI